MNPTVERILAKHPKIRGDKLLRQLGTLGGGNHFIELCLDEEDTVWVMLHSGSRGTGNIIGQYFIERAREELRRDLAQRKEEIAREVERGLEKARREAERERREAEEDRRRDGKGGGGNEMY